MIDDIYAVWADEGTRLLYVSTDENDAEGIAEDFRQAGRYADACVLTHEIAVATALENSKGDDE